MTLGFVLGFGRVVVIVVIVVVEVVVVEVVLLGSFEATLGCWSTFLSNAGALVLYLGSHMGLR